MSRNNPNHTVTLCFMFLSTAYEPSKVKQLQSLASSLLPETSPLTALHSRIIVSDAYLLHPYPHFTKYHLNPLERRPPRNWAPKRPRCYFILKQWYVLNSRAGQDIWGKGKL